MRKHIIASPHIAGETHLGTRFTDTLQLCTA